MGANLVSPTMTCEEVAAILKLVPSTPQALVDWIMDEEPVQPADLGSGTKDEDTVPALVTALLSDQASLRIHQKSVTMVWWLCLTSMSWEEGIARSQVRQNDDAPPDLMVAETAWAPFYDHRILPWKLLIETTLRSIHNELHARPRQHTACWTHSALVFRASQAPAKRVDANNEISDKYNSWMRIRAWLLSVAMLAIAEKPTCLSEAEADADNWSLLKLMHRRYNGTPAPLSQSVTTYLRSAQKWVERVRDQNPEKTRVPAPSNLGPDISNNTARRWTTSRSSTSSSREISELHHRCWCCSMWQGQRWRRHGASSCRQFEIRQE